MNPTSKFSLPAGLDPVVAAVMEQLQEKVEAKNRVIAQKDQALAAAEAIIQQLREALRLERIHKYGKQSEKLSDLQLDLLDREPAVSSEEIETEAASGPVPEAGQEKVGEAAPQRKNRQHPGRNELPAHLKRIEEIVACAAEQCRCGKCGAETRVIGYEETEVLGMKPAVHFVRVIKREKRACARCIEHAWPQLWCRNAFFPSRSLPTKPSSISSSANIATRFRSIASVRSSCATSASMWR